MFLDPRQAMRIFVGVLDDDVDDDEEADDDNEDKTTLRCSEHIFRHKDNLLRVYSDCTPSMLRACPEQSWFSPRTIWGAITRSVFDDSLGTLGDGSSSFKTACHSVVQ